MSARQEVLNTELARLLCQQGLVALPEQRLKQGKMPDLLLPFRGFYLVIEAEVDDQLQAQDRAWRKAVERVEQGLAHLALALVYPAALRELPPTASRTRFARPEFAKTSAIDDLPPSGSPCTQGKPTEGVQNLLPRAAPAFREVCFSEWYYDPPVP